MTALSSWKRANRAACVAACAVAAWAGACNEHGIVGITSERVARDAGASHDAAPGTDADGASLPIALDDCLPVNHAGLDTATAQHLVDGSGDASAMRFLYPYDGTVFPRGIPGPTLMWDAPAAGVVYVHLHSSTFDYQGCLNPTGPNLLDLPSGVWDLAAASTKGAADPFTLDLKVYANETIYGPITEQLVIATGSLPGSVYFMEMVLPASEMAVMRVRAGAPAETFLSFVCTGCHAASANGTRFLAYSSGSGGSFTSSGSSSPKTLLGSTPGAEFAGISPDGSVYVAGAHPTGGGGPRTYGGGVTNAGLYDMATGMLVADSGVPAGAGMPAFSPDGTQLAFTDFGASAGHTLARMSFSSATRVASDSRPLYSTETEFVGWPTFLPDGNAVVFAQGAAADFSGQDVGLVPVITGPPTDLFIVDTAGTSTMLFQAAGFHSSADAETGQTYLPGGAADLHENYYPSVSPAATGGYAWALFDSMRTYGNLGVRRGIWITALTLHADGTYADDPSHPPFYLPGQNVNSVNFRGVAAFDPP